MRLRLPTTRVLSAVDPLAGYAAERTIDIKHLGEGQSIVRVDARAKYLLLPVEESSPESKLYMIVDNDVVRTFNVRLAVNKVDYFVPVSISPSTSSLPRNRLFAGKR